VESSGEGGSTTEPPRKSCNYPDFDTFYRMHYRDAVAFVMVLGGSKSEAEDATQSAMIDLLRNWERVEKRLAWMKRAARNFFIKARDRERGKTILVRELPSSADHGAGSNAEFDVVEIAELLEDMRRKLPPKQAEVLSLAIEGFEPREIAEMLASTYSTTRSNLRYARSNARQILRQALSLDDELNLLREGDQA
jgi:RNA polymerase sigma factor (sigma-70 family)